MFVLGNLVIAVGQLFDMVLNVLFWLILIRALVSWVTPDPFNPIVQFLLRTTEPVLEPIRRILPPMAIDLSPFIAFLLIVFIRSFVVQTLVDIGLRLKL